MSVRILMSWIVGALIVLGTFNHAIVSTIEIVFGMRYGADGNLVRRAAPRDLRTLGPGGRRLVLIREQNLYLP